MDELGAIKAKMVEAGANHDYEGAHVKADELLCELLHFLASRMSEESRKEVEAILTAYEEVGKWYA